MNTLLQTSNRTASTIAYYAAFVALGLVMSVLGPTLTGLADNTGSRLSEISYLFTARSLGYMIGALTTARFYDRLPGHLVMGVALLIVVGVLALMPVIPLLWLLTAVLLIAGIAQSTVDVGGNTLLLWLYQEKVTPYMNGLHFFFGVGAFISPIIIAQAVLISGDINWAFWTLALLILPIGLLILRLPSPASEQVEAAESENGINYRLIALVALFLLLYVGAEASFNGWIYTYAVSLELGSVTAAAYLTSAFWGALTAGRLAAIPLAAHIRPRLLILIGLIGCLVSMGLIWMGSGLATAVWVGTISLGFFMGPIFPTTLSFAERHTIITGQVTGWIFVGASLGGMTVPWLIGQFFESIGPQMLMIIVAVDLAVALIVYAGLMRVARKTRDSFQ